MSKIVNGVRILINQGPKGIMDRIKEKKELQRQEALFLEKTKRLHLITDEERRHQKEQKFTNPYKFSIITPLYNTPEHYLRELIESLEKQTYFNWELCLADGSDKEHSYVKEICQEWQKKDKRIIYHSLEKNEGISQNTNECIKLASGDYFGLLDHDDILHESALYEMMCNIEKYHADFLYSDEAKFSEKIEEADFFNFKPGFGKDELRSHNYICHFTVFSKALLMKDGCLYRSEFDGSQDHDMVLRLTEKAERIVHIPKILYYWRVHPGSVSMDLDSKSYAVDAAIRAVKEQIERAGEPGVVASNLPYRTAYRIKYDIREKDNSVAVVAHGIENEEEFECFKEKVSSITQFSGLKFIAMTEQKNENWGSCLNRIIAQNEADYFVIMDVHCLPVNPEWIEEMLMFAQRKDVALAAPKILFENDTIAYAGVTLEESSKSKLRFLCQGISDEEQGYEAMLRYVRNTTSVWRGCFMVERAKFEQLKGVSESLPEYEEVDLALRAIDCGFWNVWTCFARIKYNRLSIPAYEEQNIQKFADRWESKLEEEDMYYHPYWRELKLV